MSQTPTTWRSYVKISALTAQFAFCAAVMLFCMIQIGIGHITVEDKVWYYSTITFIVGLVIPTPSAGSSSTKAALTPPVFMPSGLSTADNSAQPTPQHVEIISKDQTHNV